MTATAETQLSGTQRYQVEEARDLLAHWDRERGGPGIYGTERTLADTTRGLLAIVDGLAASFATLRAEVQQDRNAYYEAACEHSEMAGHEEQEARASGRVSAYDDVLRMLAEAGTGSEGSEGHGQD